MRQATAFLLSATLLLSIQAWGETMIESTTVVYKTVGDLPIQLEVYRKAPKVGAVEETATGSPVIVWIHGGALIIGSRAWIKEEQLNLYLDQGYVVVAIDYRLAPETHLPEIISDVRDALLWVRERGPSQFGIDPDRMAVIGHSAGGYLTLMSGTLVDPPPKALVAFYGYGDIVGNWYSEPDSHYLQQERVSEEEAMRTIGEAEIAGTTETGARGKFYLYCRQNGLWPDKVGGVSPSENPAFLEPFCPAKNV
ncbi:MAG: alpha/beta hydrolase, partial [Candidatus Omnitrophica bacterium]|nr:alpha/beta hydrolase [Candidatus Omnitrophota bacterium]